MTAPVDPNRFEEMYRDGRTAHGLPAATPWDIGGSAAGIVQQLVSLGAIKGEVSIPAPAPATTHPLRVKGLSATGIDSSPAAIERARQNAQKAGVSVDFQVADATSSRSRQQVRHRRRLRLLHVFATEPELQKSYAQALHRATKPGALLFMFEFGAHSVNGFKMPRSLSEDDFRQVFPAAGWENHLPRADTYQGNISVETFDMMAARNPDTATK